MKKILWASTVFFLILPPAFAQIVPGTGDWRTLRTEHFEIHYQSEFKAYAERIGGIAEKVHARLEPAYQTGANHTHINLVFSSDLVNSWATPYGLDQITLYLDNPRAGDFSRFDLWAEILLTHEYTHIQTLRYTGNPFLYAFRILFGLQPNLLSPYGFTEGIAVYEESKPSGQKVGRINDPVTRMFFRTAILEDVFPNLGEVINGSHRWPQGTTWYLYGGRLMQYIADTYGDDAHHEYWRSPRMPFFPDGRFPLRVPPYYILYRDYKEKETTEFSAEIEKIRAQGVTPMERLTEDGQRKTFLLFSNDQLLFFSKSGHSKPGIFSMGAQTAEAPQRVRYVRDVQGFTEAGGRRIAAEDYYFYPGWGIRYELYDNNALLFERLTPGSHAAYPSLSPDGSRIAYIERDDQERRLLVRSADFDDEPAILFRVPYNGILQFTSISPDGKKIVFLARNGERGGGDITVCNLEGPAECQSVVTGPGVKSAPVFSRDGKTVIFSSDVDGVFNLYSAGLDSHEVKRLTRTLTGLFFPAPGPDYLYSIGYYSNGYDVVRMKYGDLLAENVDYFRKQEEEQIEPESTPQNWTHEEYSGVFDIKPWFTGLVNIFGAAGPSVFDLGFAARDPLDRHYFAAAIGTGSPDPVAALYYDYSRYNLGFTADYTTNSWKKHSPSGCINDDDPLRFLCDSKYSFRQEAYAALRYTSQNRYVNFQILPGYMVQELRNARVIRTTEYDARDLNLIGPALTILAGQAEYYPTSISAEHGWNFFVDGQYYTKDRSRKELDGAYSHAIEYGKVEGGLSLYLPSFFDHHVNYLNAYGYTVFGPDREIQKVSLNRFVRGLDYGKAPSDHSAFVGTYEYRLPILWYSKEITKDSSAIMLRSIGMSVFFDYGQSFDRQLYRDRWNGSYGASVFVGLNMANLHLADFKITIARGMGPAGELQAYLSLYSGFDDGIITDYDSNKSPILSPYHRSMPGRQDMPGYFREQMAGGVLQ